MGELENIVIIGGGPAGANCALELANRGIYATIFDHSHPREKPCGGGIPSRTIEKFPFIKSFSSKGYVPTKARIISSPPQNNQFIVNGNLKKSIIISRQYFDEQLLKIALKSGAKLIKEKVIEITHNNRNGWQIRTNKRSLNAKIVVGADGITSIVRRRTFGKNMTDNEYAREHRQNLDLTFGYIASGVESDPPTIRYLGKIPGGKKEDFPGYIWIFPRLENSSIGIGSELRYGSLLKKLLDQFISCYCPHIKRISTFSWMLPSVTDPNFFNKPCAGEDWILVGDAAWHADPVHGEGIYYALWSSQLAAEAIKRKDLKSYDSAWRTAYGNKFKEKCKQKTWFYSPLGKAASIIKSGAHILETKSV